MQSSQAWWYTKLDEPAYGKLLTHLHTLLSSLISSSAIDCKQLATQNSAFFCVFLKKYPRNNWSQLECDVGKAFFQAFIRLLNLRDPTLDSTVTTISNMVIFSELYSQNRSVFTTTFTTILEKRMHDVGAYAEKVQMLLSKTSRSIKSKMAKAGKATVSKKQTKCIFPTKFIQEYINLYSSFFASHYHFFKTAPLCFQQFDQQLNVIQTVNDIYCTILSHFNSQLKESQDEVLARQLTILRANIISFVELYVDTYLNAHTEDTWHEELLCSLEQCLFADEVEAGQSGTSLSLVADLDTFFQVCSRLNKSGQESSKLDNLLFFMKKQYFD
jgi:hypothetical protein